jgi:hypothetical protein
MIRLSLVGIAFACVPDADERMRNLLETLILEFEAAQTAPVEAPVLPETQFVRA